MICLISINQDDYDDDDEDDEDGGDGDDGDDADDDIHKVVPIMQISWHRIALPWSLRWSAETVFSFFLKLVSEIGQRDIILNRRIQEKETTTFRKLENLEATQGWCWGW